MTQPTLDEQHLAAQQTYSDLTALEAVTREYHPDLPAERVSLIAKAVAHGVNPYKWRDGELERVIHLTPILAETYRRKLAALVAARKP